MNYSLQNTACADASRVPGGTGMHAHMTPSAFTAYVADDMVLPAVHPAFEPSIKIWQEAPGG